MHSSESLAVVVSIVSLMATVIGWILAYGRKTRADAVRDAKQDARFQLLDREVSALGTRLDARERSLAHEEAKRQAEYAEIKAALTLLAERSARVEAAVSGVNQRIDDVLRQHDTA